MSPRRRHEVSRLEAFSDAVFAFSATLLVVSLEVPSTLDSLLEQLPGFVIFGLSFAALVLIWSVHRAFFRRYGLDDPVTVALNSVLLFVVLFYVYPLKFVARGVAFSVLGIEREATLGMVSGPEQLGDLFTLYGVGFIAIFLCVALMYRNALAHREELGLDDAEVHDARKLFRHYLLFPAVGLLSIGLGEAGVGLTYGVPGWIYALLGPLCALHDWASDRWASAASS